MALVAGQISSLTRSMLLLLVHDKDRCANSWLSSLIKWLLMTALARLLHEAVTGAHFVEALDESSCCEGDD